MMAGAIIAVGFWVLFIGWLFWAAAHAPIVDEDLALSDRERFEQRVVVALEDPRLVNGGWM